MSPYESLSRILISDDMSTRSENIMNYRPICHRLLRFIFFWSLLIFGSCSKAQSAEVEYIYMRNNGISPADIWVNGYYQGYIPAGETRLLDKKGFETYESARTQSDGTISKREHSHGSWVGSGITEVFVCQIRNGQAFQSVVRLPKDCGAGVGADPSKHPKIWFGETTAGEEFEVTGNEKPIEKGKEGNDCSVSSTSGFYKTNVKAKESGEWVIRYRFSDGSGGKEYWNMRENGFLSVRNGNSYWTGRWRKIGDDFSASYGPGGIAEYQEWWTTKDGVANGYGVVKSTGSRFTISGQKQDQD